MSEPIYVAFALVFLVVHVFALLGLGRGLGGHRWAMGAAALYASAAIGALAGDLAWAAPTRAALFTVFAGSLYSGSRRFALLSLPRWFDPALLTLALVRGVLTPMFPLIFTLATGAALLCTSALLSSSLVLRRSGSGNWDRVLILGNLGLSAASIHFIMNHLADSGRSGDMSVWILAAIFAGGSQVCAIFDRRAAAQQLRGLTLESLLDSSPAGLVLSDRAGRVEIMTRPFAERLGIEPAESCIGTPASEVLERLRSLSSAEDDPAAWAEPSSGPTAQELHLGDGRVMLFERHPLTDERGESKGELAALSDVTELDRRNRELANQRRLDSLGFLAAGIAHDFNNKLAVILAGARHLGRQLDQADEKAEIASEIEDAANFCAAMTRDLLSFADDARRSPERVKVEAFVLGVVERLRLPEGTRVEVKHEGCHTILADPVQLERVLTNLVSNASDASQGTSLITIEVQRADFEQADNVMVAVCDDGSGIPADELERVFDPFYTTKDVGEGTGLGLGIVRSVVNAHGGEVRVESSPGRGTRVETLWPLAEPVPAAGPTC